MSYSIFDRSEQPFFRSLGQQVTHFLRAIRLVWNSSPRWTGLYLGLVVVQGLLPLASLYLTKQIVDLVSAGISAAGQQPFQPVLIRILLVFGVAVVSAACRSLSDLAGQAQGMQVTDAVSDLLHAQSITLDLKYYENPAYHETLHRAQQEAPYRPTHLLNGLVQVVQNGISLLGIIGLLLTFSWLIGLVLFCAALPGALARFLFARKQYTLEQEQTESERRAWYYHWMLVDAEFAKELRLFQLGPFFQKRFHLLRQGLRKGRLDLSRRRSIIDLLIQVLSTTAIYGTLGLAAFQAWHGVITLGSLMAIFIGFQSGLGFLTSILQGLAGLYEDSLFLTNFYQFLDLQPGIESPVHPHPLPEQVEHGICFDQVSFTYPGSLQPALHDINLILAPGEVVALVGENGSGKTTLIKLLCRLYAPDNGHITLDGIDLSQFDPVRWRRELSVIFQDYIHYYLPAWENIWLGDITKTADRQRIQETAKRTGANAVFQRLPKGYDSHLGTWFEQGTELSTGEWQKVALARALWRDASIVVLDEPSSSLDPLAEAEFFQCFRQHINGRSAILISHRFSTIQMADRIYVLDQGRIVESGSHAALLRQGGQYYQLYHAQAEHYREGTPPDG